MAAMSSASAAVSAPCGWGGPRNLSATFTVHGLVGSWVSGVWGLGLLGWASGLFDLAGASSMNL
eukprot:5769851-Pyramimonas_sp.AAC.1